MPLYEMIGKSFIMSLGRLVLSLSLVSYSGSLTFMNDKRSYAMYEPWDASKEAAIKFRFQTHNSYGLLFYVDDGKDSVESGNFFQLMIDKGVIMMTMQLSTEEKPTVKHDIMLGNSLNDGQWHEVEVTRNNKITVLRVDGLQRVISLPQDQKSIRINSNLFIGGTPRHYEQLIVNKFLRYTTRFVGCIDRLSYSSMQGDASFPRLSNKMLSTQDVRQGCLNACRYQGGSCPNGGQCVNLFNRVGCDCLGTGYEGVNCTIRSPSIYLKGFDYITWKSVGPGEATANRVQLRFKCAVDSGILVIVGSPYTKYILVELMEGKLMVHAKLDGKPLTLTLAHYGKLNDWNWHVIEVYRREDRLNVVLDSRVSKNGTIDVINRRLGVPNTAIKIGGHFNPSVLEASRSKRHYIGCLQQMYCDGTNVINEAIHERSKRVKIHGNVAIGCPLEPTDSPLMTKTTKNTIDADSWMRGHQNGGFNSVNRDDKRSSKLNLGQPKENKSPVQSARKTRRKKDMSQSTITGITAGTIVGAIAVIIAVACFINHLKKKYSGVFITSTMYTRGESFEHTPFHNGDAQLYLTSPTGRPVKGARV